MQISGSIDMKTVVTSKAASTTTHGRSPKRAKSLPQRLTKTLFSLKVNFATTPHIICPPADCDPQTGYKEYKTDRTYMARMGDWRENKDFEIPLDGIGGVNILVKADVHRSGKSSYLYRDISHFDTNFVFSRHQLPMLRFREPSRNRRLCQDGQARRLRRLRPTQLRCLAHRYGGEAR